MTLAVVASAVLTTLREIINDLPLVDGFVIEITFTSPVPPAAADGDDTI